VNSKNRDALIGSTSIYTPFVRQSLEAKFNDGFVERLVPNATSLLHTVNALHQMHDPVFLSTRFETGRLFHKDCFGFRKNAVEEGCFDVNVLHIPVKDCSNVE
jgi:hypothetical protein